MGGAIVEQLGEFFYCYFRCLRLFGGEFANRCKERGIDSASVEKESAENFENASFVGGIERWGIIGNSCELGFGAVVGSLPWVWRMFGFAWRRALEAMQCTIDVSGHGYVACARSVVPIESQATIVAAGPVQANFVCGLEGVDEMLGVGASGISNSKIVDDETENYVLCVVAPEAGSQRAWVVAVGREELDKFVVCKASGLWQAIHAAADFDVDEFVVDERGQIVLLDDVVGQHPQQWNSHVFVTQHGRSEVEIFEVGSKKFCVGRGEGAVEE